MSFWNLKEIFDELFWFGSFNIRETIQFFNAKNKILKTHHSCTHWSIITNGPSANKFKYNPDKIENKNFVFVNFGYKRSEFSIIEEPFLLIVDENLINGTWPNSMLGDAFNLNKNCKFILNYKFKDYVKTLHQEIQKRVIFIFNSKIPTQLNIKYSKPTSKFGFGVGAAEQAISFCMQLGGKVIDIYGLDCNNVLLALSEKNTHIYGIDPHKKWDDPSNNARELRFQSYMLNRLILIKIFANKNKIDLNGFSDGLIVKFMK